MSDRLGTHDLRKINSALNRAGTLLEETSVMDAKIRISAEDVEESFEDSCSEITPCGVLGDGDEINEFVSEVIDQFVEQGMEEEAAEEMVFEAMAEFIESGALADTPDVDVPEKEKREWIRSFDKLLEHKFSE